MAPHSCFRPKGAPLARHKGNHGPIPIQHDGSSHTRVSRSNRRCHPSLGGRRHIQNGRFEPVCPSNAQFLEKFTSQSTPNSYTRPSPEFRPLGLVAGGPPPGMGRPGSILDKRRLLLGRFFARRAPKGPKMASNHPLPTYTDLSSTKYRLHDTRGDGAVHACLQDGWSRRVL